MLLLRCFSCDASLAQKPYITLGSLRDNVLYPGADADTRDAEILAALDKVFASFFIDMGMLIPRKTKTHVRL